MTNIEQLPIDYGWHSKLPDVTPALEIYSLRHRLFARIDSISTRGAKLGEFSPELLKKKNPKAMPPEMGWNHRIYAGKKFADLTQGGLFRPARITLAEGLYKLFYNTGWGIDEFETILQFRKADLDRTMEQKISNKTSDTDVG